MELFRRQKSTTSQFHHQWPSVKPQLRSTGCPSLFCYSRLHSQHSWARLL